MVVGNRQPDSGLRERKKQQTRATLIEAALELCLRQGYEQTTVDQIALAAQVSPRTYSRYFPTKEAVFLTLLDQLSEDLGAELRRLPRDLGPVEALRAAHVATLTRAAGEPVGPVGSDRVVLMLRVIVGSEALRQAAFDFRHPAVVGALGEQMGVAGDDRRLQLGLSVFSALILDACGDLVENTDGTLLGPLLIVERLNRACEQLADFSARIFRADEVAAGVSASANA